MPAESAPIPWNHLGRMLLRFAPLWCGSFVVFSVLGTGYGLVRTRQWKASQPLLVRDEATGSIERLGRFAHPSEMKAAQETIIEMAKSAEVVALALRQVGPPARRPRQPWPTPGAIEEAIEEQIVVRPPKGAELGTTEVIYLETSAESADRAETLCDAVYEQLTARLRTVRRLRADSVLAELTESQKLAARRLDEATERLQRMETGVGSDLGELRNLSETISGDGSARRTLVDVQSQLQQAELDLDQLNHLRMILEAGRTDPARLLVAGGDLLTSQPTLKRLKDGLIDAQLSLSRLAGKYNEDHPRMRAARATAEEIRVKLREEVSSAISAMEPSLAIARERVARLTAKQADLESRLARLAGMRAEYAQTVAEVRQRTEQLGEAERALAEAEANLTATLSTSLVAALGPPQAGDRPTGPGLALLALGGASAGLVFGFGVVFLIAPAPSGDRRFGRRWSDYLGGRRASDATRAATVAPATGDRRAKPREEPAAIFREGKP